MFSHDDLAALVAEHPSIALQMLGTLGQRLADADRRLALSTLEVDVRVADLNRPGFDGDSVYWIPTRAWSVRFVA
ncbi:hypothetical protein [Micrococcus terreus]|uniref:CRP/FNR family transcriptional regulator, anaerobic regulatory protein n=1 Tax=Micrococcus terreus TaxID=574650 RepID=A0A1I7MMA7_9MICC|nr:hypothetical protein [Micrococcus terreus]SFV23047.1 CRP/FNR family transcriptional regulator, anaerobic regulatory protein [Micrococcus terreus]